MNDWTLADAVRRDAEMNTSPLWLGWQHGHPTLAEMARDRRELLALLREMRKAVKDHEHTMRHAIIPHISYRALLDRTAALEDRDE